MLRIEVNSFLTSLALIFLNASGIELIFISDTSIPYFLHNIYEVDSHLKLSSSVFPVSSSADLVSSFASCLNIVGVSPPLLTYKTLSSLFHSATLSLFGISSTAFISTGQSFKRAVNFIRKHTNNPVFYIFTDPGSVVWCKENFKIFGLDGKKDIVRFVDWNKGKDSFRDMQLMAACKHQVITNSTFGWWGAYFNLNPNKITCSPFVYINTTHTF